MEEGLIGWLESRCKGGRKKRGKKGGKMDDAV